MTRKDLIYFIPAHVDEFPSNLGEFTDFDSLSKDVSHIYRIIALKSLENNIEHKVDHTRINLFTTSGTESTVVETRIIIS